jgi:hypothetical protein
MRFGFAPIRGSNPRASAAHLPLSRASSERAWRASGAHHVAVWVAVASVLALQRPAYPFTRVLHLERGNMGVTLSRRYSRMTENLLNDTDIYALLDRQRGSRVPGIVRCSRSSASSASGIAELACLCPLRCRKSGPGITPVRHRWPLLPCSRVDKITSHWTTMAWWQRAAV